MATSPRFHCYIAMVVLVVTWCMASRANAVITVFGDFEGSGDGWFDWSDGLLVDDPAEVNAGKYTLSSTTGVELGSNALHLHTGVTGYNQNLSFAFEHDTTQFKTQHAEFRGAFFSNRAIAIDITYPGNSAAGYQEIYGLDFNAAGYGYHSEASTNPITGTFFGTPNGNHTVTLVFNYSALLDVNGGPISTATNPDGSYVTTFAEFNIATNGGDADHEDTYFDNARFFTPGDMNNDGVVDVNDVSAMISALSDTTGYANSLGLPATDIVSDGDVNGDDVFNNLDVQSLISQLANNNISGNHYVGVVPEPTSLVLFGLAAPALLWAVRKRSRVS